MILGSPVGPAACEGVLIASQPWKRHHCPGCAETASLRERLATAEADGLEGAKLLARAGGKLERALADAAAMREQLAAMELREKQAWNEVHVQSARNQRLVEDLHAGTSNTTRMLVKQRDELEARLATAESLALTNGEARGRAEARLAALRNAFNAWDTR